jgi:hypothetical protein
MTEKVLELQQLFLDLTEEWYEENCKDGGWFEPSGGKGIFGTALTIWLMMLQGLYDCSMGHALELLRAGAADLILKRNRNSREAQRREFSPNTGGYSRAKGRLPLVDIEDVIAVVNRSLLEESNKSLRNEEKIYALDGTDFVLEHTPEIMNEFPCGNYRHGKLHHPEMRAVFATEQKSGIATLPQLGPSRGKKATSEQALSSKVIEEIEAGSLIIADQNFGVFSVVSHATRHHKKVLVRMIKFRGESLIKRARASVSGECDLKLRWEQSEDDQLLAADDPSAVDGRLIRCALNKKGFRPLVLYFFTTTDLDVERLKDIYGRRVDIETDIRYLKYMYGMERILSKKAETAKKEILVRLVAFNLVRRVVAGAAAQIGLPTRRISFARAVGYTKVFGTHIINAQSQEEREMLYAEYLKVLSQCKLPNRPRGRHEPRMITRRKQKFLVMKKPREILKKKFQKNGDFR